jgi:kynurenine 3-monooxygenase
MLPWTYKDKIALIGTLVMLSCLLWTRYERRFEDISILSEMMEEYGDDWEMIFQNTIT